MCFLSSCFGLLIWLGFLGVLYFPLPTFFSLADSKACLVRILGHSYVFWGARRTEVRTEGRQLGLSRSEVRVRWLGVPGILWSRILPDIHLYCGLDRPPDVVLLHVTVNDLCLYAMRELVGHIELCFLGYHGCVVGYICHV